MMTVHYGTWSCEVLSGDDLYGPLEEVPPRTWIVDGRVVQLSRGWRLVPLVPLKKP